MTAYDQSIQGVGETGSVRELPEGSIEARYRTLNSARQAKLDRARQCAALG